MQAARHVKITRAPHQPRLGSTATTSLVNECPIPRLDGSCILWMQSENPPDHDEPSLSHPGSHQTRPRHRRTVPSNARRRYRISDRAEAGRWEDASSEAGRWEDASSATGPTLAELPLTPSTPLGTPLFPSSSMAASNPPSAAVSMGAPSTAAAAAGRSTANTAAAPSAAQPAAAAAVKRTAKQAFEGAWVLFLAISPSFRLNMHDPVQQ